MSNLEFPHMPRTIATALCAAAALLTASAATAPALAAPLMSEGAPTRVIHVSRDKSLSFRLDQPASKIVVAQPDIAEVVATTDRSFYVRGVDVGATNLLVYGPAGRLMEVIDIRVGVDAAALEADLAEALPTAHIRVQSLGEGVLLTGDVANPGIALRAAQIAEKFAPQSVTSMLRIAGSQVVLEVRILEATRSTAHDLGLGATITNGNFNFTYGAGLVGAPVTLPGQQPPLVGLIGNSAPYSGLRFVGRVGDVTVDAQLAALEEKGIVRTLARPNLTALSGEKASFLAGGEFPYPVPSGLNQTNVEFRPYGVKLTFLPIVQDDGKIRLAVEPEVSELDTSNTLRVGSVTVPALTVRRTSTTVELKNGESLAIGGLFQRGYTNALRQVPGLGNIPILSSLFRSTRWQRNETELLIIVTPHILTQGDIDSDKDRTIPGVEPTPADLILHGRALDKAMANDLRGPTDQAPAPPQQPAVGQQSAKNVPAASADGK